jgi:hypothetical protein
MNQQFLKDKQEPLLCKEQDLQEMQQTMVLLNKEQLLKTTFNKLLLLQL